MNVLIEYEKRPYKFGCDGEPKGFAYRRVGVCEHWWRIGEEAHRVGRKVYEVKRSIKHNRPTDVPWNAVMIIGGDRHGDWMTPKQIQEEFGFSRYLVKECCDMEKGLYLFREPLENYSSKSRAERASWAESSKAASKFLGMRVHG